MSGNYAYITDGNLQIINVLDPVTPFLIANYEMPQPAYQIHVQGNYAYALWDSLQIIQISN